MQTPDFHPDFKKRIENDLFPGVSLLEALNDEVPVSIRRNPLKVASELPIESEIHWCKNAFYLKERPVFTLDPLFHAGSYYPQEAGSMVIDSVLRQLELPNDPIILDLCGAPGGKSTLVLSFLNESGLLVSNEVIQSRSRILKENCVKWGFSNSIVTNNDPSDFQRLPNFFDAILVDAPCSGEGMFRKDPASRSEWSEDNVSLCSARQKRILGNIWSSLKPGGFIIYSTCTFNADENEENVAWLQSEFAAEVQTVIMPESFVSGRNDVGDYAIPGKTKAEGFFIAVLRKPEDISFSVSKKTKHGAKGKAKGKSKAKNDGLSQEKDLSPIQDFVKLDGTVVWRWKEYLLGMPENVADCAMAVYDSMRIVKLGTEIGTLARKGFVPSHDLSMIASLRKVTNSIELAREEALKYLRGETFALSGKRGVQMVSFQNEPLGWIKHLGNRFNNGYPKEWRIKMKLK